MSETLALVRFAIARHRMSLTLVISIALIGIIAAISVASVGTDDAEGIAIVTIVITMVPAVVWTFVLFVFHGNVELLENESCIDRWLLRMPIAAWKLALVPVALKTTWTILLWFAFNLSMRYITGDHVALLNPAIAFSAAGVWLMALTWRPFANRWWRLAALLVCGAALLACVTGALIDDVEFKLGPGARLLFVAGIYAMYFLGVWMAIRAVALARSSSHGLISERKWISNQADETVTPVRHFSSPRRALIWHDIRKSRGLWRFLFFVGVIPGILFLIFVVPFCLPGYIASLVLFAYVGIGAGTNVVDKTGKGVIVLPPHIGASPLSTAEIAWTRLFIICAFVFLPMMFSLIVFAGWALWPENRETWVRWAGEMTEKTGSPSAGLQIAAASFLGSCALLVSRAAALVWPALCGRTWLHFSTGIAMAIGYFLPMAIGIGWFLQQASWEETQESALYWASYLPAVLITLLILKTVGVVIASQQLWVRQLVMPRGIGMVIVGWGLLTCAIAIAMHLLIPHPLATLPACLAVVALVIPLVRVLILPVSLHFGRHL